MTFNLSEKTFQPYEDSIIEVIQTKDVKEFIKLLKEELYSGQYERILKLAGDKLT
jgi:hypothetical protein